MQDIIFDTVSDETTILAIGSLFRRGDNKQWGVNLDLTPKAETASLSLSNIPVLARKRVLNPTQEHKPAGFHLSFTIDNTDNWQKKRLGDYPVSSAIRAMDKRQHCFCFLANGIEIYLPNWSWLVCFSCMMVICPVQRLSLIILKANFRLNMSIPRLPG